MRVPQYNSHMSGEMTINTDGTITRVAQHQPGLPFDDLFWWAGYLLDVKPGDLVTGVYREDGGVHRLDPDTVKKVSQ